MESAVCSAAKSVGAGEHIVVNLNLLDRLEPVLRVDSCALNEAPTDL
jgi:hypothetical protein